MVSKFQQRLLNEQKLEVNDYDYVTLVDDLPLFMEDAASFENL